MPRAHALRAVSALVAVAALALAACSSPGASPDPSRGVPQLTDPAATASSAPMPSAVPTASLTPNVPLYLVDVNTTDELGAELPLGILTGVKGTIPGGEVPAPFRDALAQVDPTLTSDAYAAEAYDATILAALGAAASSSDAGRDIAAELAPLTNGDTVCTDFAECRDLVAGGTSIAYQGRAGALRLSASGEPTQSTVGVYTFGSDNRLLADVDYADVQIQPGKVAAPREAKVQAGAGDKVLTIGTLLAAGGSLSFMRPAQLAGVQLAVRDIQAAGGLPGFDRIAVIDADAGDGTVEDASIGMDELIASKADVVIGTGAMTSTGGVVPQAVKAGILLLAPVNGALTPITNAYDGLYWRMSPSGLAQGAFLGSLVVEDGHTRVAVIHSDDEYASSLAQVVASSVPQSGGTVVANADYDPAAVDFAGVVAKVKKAKPDAVVLIGFDESAKVISELVRQGIGPNSAR